MALEDDLNKLYSCPPGEFLDRRKALAQALRKAGRKDDAAAVAGAVKPTPAAWAVNQLARTSPEEMAELLGIGERLRALVRASFTGRPDAGAMTEAQSEQREAVARLARLAGQALEGAGASRSQTVIERVTATLTTISTTGAWGDGPPGRLTRDLEPPGIEALAALVGDVASGAARERTPVPTAARAEAAPRAEAAAREDAAARAAALGRAEASLQAAALAEEQARTACEAVRAAALGAASEREKREAAAREARHLAAEEAQAADEARRRAEAAALAAKGAEAEAAAALRAERAAKDELAAAEKALARATSDCVAAEEAVVRERRATSGNLSRASS